jgi:hypothetical protein
LLGQFQAIIGATTPDERRATAKFMYNNFSRLEDCSLLDFFTPSLRFLGSI